jgi:hypothetical protein
MKTSLVSAMLLVATSAYAAPDDQTPPINDPDAPTDSLPMPSDPDPTAEPPAPPAVPPVDPVPSEPTPVYTNINVFEQAPSESWYSMSRAGFALTAGGGVQGFTGDTMRNTTADGGNWDVRAGFGTRLPVSIEASYLGSAQQINALGLDSNALLVGNGVQGNLRINATTGNIPIQPFLFGGVAWRRYQLQNTNTNTSDVIGEDDVLEVPLGIGVAYKHKGFTLDARGEYRPSFYSNLVPDSGSNAFADPASLDRWGVNANIGVEF